MTDPVRTETLRRPWVLHPAFRLAAAVVAIGLVSAAWFVPMWTSRMVAPQYPMGLNLQVYLHGATGDTMEVNILNHYVGMCKVEEMATIERAFALPLIVLVSLLALAGALLADRRWRLLLSAPLIGFPVGFLVDFFSWLYYAGHALDPTSPLSMTVKPFTPALWGYQRVANFDVWSKLGPGTWLIVAGSTVLAAAVFAGWRAAARR